MAGDVELNPGPVNYAAISKSDCEKILTILKENDGKFSMPNNKADMVSLLQGENQTVVAIIVHSLKGPDSNAPSSSQVQQILQPKISTVKLPIFFENDTRQWFDQVEQILTGCPDDVRKNSLLRTLPTSVIRDTGVNVTASFLEIKNRLITHFDDTLEQKLRKLLKEQNLGDQKPSTALRRLQQLAPGNDSLVRLRFLEMLPMQARVVLATFESERLDKLAEAADKMLDQIPSTSHTNAVAATANTASSSNSNSLLEQITELTKTVNAISTTVAELKQSRNDNRGSSNNRNYRYPRSGSRSGSNFSRNRSPPQNHENSDLCFYHSRFGHNAFRCRSPCTWENRTSGLPSGNGRTPTGERRPTE